jgi:DNA uptake protein ComE-like DNA-binding protein
VEWLVPELEGESPDRAARTSRPADTSEELDAPEEPEDAGEEADAADPAASLAEAERRAEQAERVAQQAIDSEKRIREEHGRELTELRARLQAAEKRADEAEERAVEADQRAEEAGRRAATAEKQLETAGRKGREAEPPAGPTLTTAPRPPGRKPHPGRGGNSKLDLNAASFDDLRDLGLTVEQSARLIALRDLRSGFQSLKDLDGLPDLPRKVVTRLKQRVTV